MIGVRLRLDALPGEDAPEHRGELIQRLVDDYGFDVGELEHAPVLDPLAEVTIVGEAPSHAAINQMVSLSADWMRQGLIPDAHLQVGHAAEIAVGDFPQERSPADLPNQAE